MSRRPRLNDPYVVETARTMFRNYKQEKEEQQMEQSACAKKIFSATKVVFGILLVIVLVT